MLKCSKFILIKNFDISTILKVTFHLPLLENVSYIRCAIQYIFEPILPLVVCTFDLYFVKSYWMSKNSSKPWQPTLRRSFW